MRAAPADTALRVDTLEVADQEHAARTARRDGPAAGFVDGEWSAQLFGEGVKCFLMQELLQPLMQDLPLTLGQLIVRKPYAALLLLPPAKTHDAPPDIV